ncbi:MAG: hypothetical protein ABIE55_02235 [Candidatus Aenigmatarchaeota archaeon]
MPSKYEIDTKFLEFLFNICIILVLFSIVFLILPFLTGVYNKSVQFMNIIFLMLFTLFLGMVFGIFIKWFVKYKNSLIRLR